MSNLRAAACAFLTLASPLSCLAGVDPVIVPKQGALGASVPLAVASVRPEVLHLPTIEGPAVQFNRLSSADGLSQTRVSQIIQDDRGFMWFGTQYGVNRYDGYEFKVFVHDPHRPDSLSGAFITALFKDREGTIWVGTDDALDRYDANAEGFTHIRVDADAKVSTPTTVVDISQDRAGFLWLSTGTGLYRLEPDTGALKHFRHDPKDPFSLRTNDVKWSGEDREGHFWVGTSDGLDEFDRTNGRTLLHIPIPEGVKVTFFQDSYGTFWITHASGNGLATFDRHSMAVTQLSFYDHDPPSAALTGVMGVLEDTKGELWFGSPGAGLLRFDRLQRQFVRYRNRGGSAPNVERQVIALFQDREGNIWTSLHAAGPGHFSLDAPGFQVFKHDAENPDGLDVDFANAIYEDTDKRLWIGNDYGLNQVDVATGKKQLWSFGLGPKPMIIALAGDPDGSIWFGTFSSGVGRFDPKSGAFTLYRHKADDPQSLSNDEVHRVLIDHAGTVWVATDDGLNRLDRGSGHFTVYKVDWSNRRSQSYLSIAEDKTGRLWLGTHYSGLHYFDPANGTFKIFSPQPTDPNSLRAWAVPFAYVSRSGLIWIATTNGLNSLNPRTGIFKAFDTANGLPANKVSCIQEDLAGALWMSTNRGLSRLDPKTGIFVNYTVADGLPGNDLTGWSACFATPDGRLFFAGFSGGITFNPRTLEREQERYPPPVVLTDFQLSGRSIRPGEKSVLHRSITVADAITLAHDQSLFTIAFSGLGYRSPASNRYRYRLDGLDTEWHEVPATRRLASYTSVPPGRYTFRVQGANARGPWTEPGASLRIEVLPPWWGTWEFRCLVAVAVMLGLWLAYVYRIRSITHQFNVRLDERVGERTRIARELHDSLLQSFQALVVHLAAIRNLLPGRPADAANALERVMDRADEALAEGRKAVHDLRSAEHMAKPLEDTLRDLGASVLAREAAGDVPSFRMVVEGKPQPVDPIVSDEVFGIAREALRNAVQHASAGQLEVELAFDAQKLRLRIRDDGVGVDPRVQQAGRHGHWGLTGMRERAQRLGALFTIWSEHGSGTEVELTIPGKIAYGRRSTLGRSVPREAALRRARKQSP